MHCKPRSWAGWIFGTALLISVLIWAGIAVGAPVTRITDVGTPEGTPPGGGTPLPDESTPPPTPIAPSYSWTGSDGKLQAAPETTEVPTGTWTWFWTALYGVAWVATQRRRWVEVPVFELQPRTELVQVGTEWVDQEVIVGWDWEAYEELVGWETDWVEVPIGEYVWYEEVPRTRTWEEWEIVAYDEWDAWEIVDWDTYLNWEIVEYNTWEEWEVVAYDEWDAWEIVDWDSWTTYEIVDYDTWEEFEIVDYDEWDSWEIVDWDSWTTYEIVDYDTWEELEIVDYDEWDSWEIVDWDSWTSYEIVGYDTWEELEIVDYDEWDAWEIVDWDWWGDPIYDWVHHSEPIYGWVEYSEPIYDYVYHQEPIYDWVHHSEPIYGWVEYSEPVWDYVYHEEPIYDWVHHSEPIYGWVEYSEPIWDYVYHEEPIYDWVHHSEPIYGWVEYSEPVYDWVLHEDPIYDWVHHSEPIYGWVEHSEDYIEQIEHRETITELQPVDVPIYETFYRPVPMYDTEPYPVPIYEEVTTWEEVQVGTKRIEVIEMEEQDVFLGWTGDWSFTPNGNPPPQQPPVQAPPLQPGQWYTANGFYYRVGDPKAYTLEEYLDITDPGWRDRLNEHEDDTLVLVVDENGNAFYLPKDLAYLGPDGQWHPLPGWSQPPTPQPQPTEEELRTQLRQLKYEWWAAVDSGDEALKLTIQEKAAKIKEKIGEFSDAENLEINQEGARRLVDRVLQWAAARQRGDAGAAQAADDAIRRLLAMGAALPDKKETLSQGLLSISISWWTALMAGDEEGRQIAVQAASRLRGLGAVDAPNASAVLAQQAEMARGVLKSTRVQYWSLMLERSESDPQVQEVARRRDLLSQYVVLPSPPAQPDAGALDLYRKWLEKLKAGHPAAEAALADLEAFAISPAVAKAEREKAAGTTPGSEYENQYKYNLRISLDGVRGAQPPTSAAAAANEADRLAGQITGEARQKIESQLMDEISAALSRGLTYDLAARNYEGLMRAHYESLASVNPQLTAWAQSVSYAYGEFMSSVDYGWSGSSGATPFGAKLAAATLSDSGSFTAMTGTSEQKDPKRDVAQRLLWQYQTDYWNQLANGAEDPASQALLNSYAAEARLVRADYPGLSDLTADAKISIIQERIETAAWAAYQAARDGRTPDNSVLSPLRTIAANNNPAHLGDRWKEIGSAMLDRILGNYLDSQNHPDDTIRLIASAFGLDWDTWRKGAVDWLWNKYMELWKQKTNEELANWGNLTAEEKLRIGKNNEARWLAKLAPFKENAQDLMRDAGLELLRPIQQNWWHLLAEDPAAESARAALAEQGTRVREAVFGIVPALRNSTDPEDQVFLNKDRDLALISEGVKDVVQPILLAMSSDLLLTVPDTDSARERWTKLAPLRAELGDDWHAVLAGFLPSDITRELQVLLSRSLVEYRQTDDWDHDRLNELSNRITLLQALIGSDGPVPGAYPSDRTEMLTANMFQPAGVSAAELISLVNPSRHPELYDVLKNEGLADLIAQGETDPQNPVNALFVLAKLIHETGWGTADWFRELKNTGAFMVNGELLKFSSWAESVTRGQSDLKELYKDQGLLNIATIAPKYAPMGVNDAIDGDGSLMNPWWPGTVADLMLQFGRQLGRLEPLNPNVTQWAIDKYDGEQVSEVQSLVARIFAEVQDAPRSGSWDDRTRAAIAQFQYFNDLPVSGIVDAVTLNALRNGTGLKPKPTLAVSGPPGTTTYVGPGYRRVPPSHRLVTGDDLVGAESVAVPVDFWITLPTGDGLGRPISSLTVTDYAGTRVSPVDNSTRAHSGTDYRAITGTQVNAAYHGKIVQVDYNSTYGNYVVIEHTDAMETKFYTQYAHLDDVTAAQRLWEQNIPVRKGDPIAKSGGTPDYPPHLHFELYQSFGPTPGSSIAVPGWNASDIWRVYANSESFFGL